MIGDSHGQSVAGVSELQLGAGFELARFVASAKRGGVWLGRQSKMHGVEGVLVEDDADTHDRFDPGGRRPVANVDGLARRAHGLSPSFASARAATAWSLNTRVISRRHERLFRASQAAS